MIMVEWSKISGILDEMRERESIIEVSLISRGGLYVMGDVPPGVHQETFAAMTAIIIGAAETISSEFKDLMNYVTINLIERNLILTNAGSKYLLAVSTFPDIDPGDALNDCKDKIAEMRSIL